MPKFVTLKEFLDLFFSICSLLVALSWDLISPKEFLWQIYTLKCYFPKNDIKVVVGYFVFPLHFPSY